MQWVKAQKMDPGPSLNTGRILEYKKPFKIIMELKTILYKLFFISFSHI